MTLIEFSGFVNRFVFHPRLILATDADIIIDIILLVNSGDQIGFGII